MYPLIVQSATHLAQVGTFLNGVAVASKVLCTSTTLNKRSQYEVNYVLSGTTIQQDIVAVNSKRTFNLYKMPIYAIISLNVCFLHI